MGNLLRDENGQAMVEYLVISVIVLAILGFMVQQFRRTVISMWQSFTKEISAPCPRCPPRPGG